MVNDIKAHALELKPERLKLEARLQEIKARSEPVDLCLERIPYFKPEMSGDLQCPRCWISNETKTSLTPVPSETEDDYYWCGRCRLEVRIVS
jgi:hypothetical protein